MGPPALGQPHSGPPASDFAIPGFVADGTWRPYVAAAKADPSACPPLHLPGSASCCCCGEHSDGDDCCEPICGICNQFADTCRCCVSPPMSPIRDGGRQ